MVDLLQFGFPLGHDNKTGSRIPPKNHQGALQYREQILQILQKEIDTKAAIGPFDTSPFGEETFYSPINSVPKKQSKLRRFILDMSYPAGNSINDGIDKDTYLGQTEKLTLPSIDKLVERIVTLGRNCKVFKVDLSRAYRQIFLDPSQIAKVAYTFDNKIYADCTLSMGSESSAKCCQMVTSAVVYIYTKWGYFAINYLDDLGSAEEDYKANTAYQKLRDLLQLCGLQEAMEKSVAPSTVMIFLGIEVNTVLFTLAIPLDKWNEIVECLNNWSIKNSANLKQTQSLAGLLNFACRCVRSGRIYLSRILNFLRSLPKTGHREIPKSVKEDINWWKVFAPRYNRVSLMLENEWVHDDMFFSTDSCLTGGGAYANGLFIHWQYPSQILKLKCDINQLECMMIVIAVKSFGKLLNRKRLIVNCDNNNSVLAINSGSSRNLVIQHCLRELHMVSAEHSFELKAKYLEGQNNRISDALSRFHLAESHKHSFKLLTNNVITKRIQIEDKNWHFMLNSF